MYPVDVLLYSFEMPTRMKVSALVQIFFSSLKSDEKNDEDMKDYLVNLLHVVGSSYR